MHHPTMQVTSHTKPTASESNNNTIMVLRATDLGSDQKASHHISFPFLNWTKPQFFVSFWKSAALDPAKSANTS